jgi:hypothetical protein
MCLLSESGSAESGHNEPFDSNDDETVDKEVTTTMADSAVRMVGNYDCFVVAAGILRVSKRL